MVMNFLDQKIWKRLKVLGTGTTGEVMLYEHNESHFCIAVKQVHVPNIITRNWQPEPKYKFCQENDIWKLLSHVRIVEYYNIVDQRTVLEKVLTKSSAFVYFCMEYMPGGSLYDNLQSHGP